MFVYRLSPPLPFPFLAIFSPNREPVHGLLEPSREIEKSSSYREFLGVRVIGSSKKIAGSKEKKTVFTAQGTLSLNSKILIINQNVT